MILDWFRARRDHASQLRFIRSELRRLAEISRHLYGWTSSGPEDDAHPSPPRLTPSFLEIVSKVDFSLTDEHTTDNAQQAMLEIADGCAALEHYYSEINKRIDVLRGYREMTVTTSKPEARTKLKSETADWTKSYDMTAKLLTLVISGAIDDTERRLKSIRLLPQLRRTLKKLPPGTNPPVLAMTP